MRLISLGVASQSLAPLGLGPVAPATAGRLMVSGWLEVPTGSDLLGGDQFPE